MAQNKTRRPPEAGALREWFTKGHSIGFLSYAIARTREGIVSQPRAMSPCCSAGAGGLHGGGARLRASLSFQTVDDPENLQTCVDAGEFVGHLGGAHAVGRTIKHCSRGLSQCFRCRCVGRQVDPDARPRHACIDVSLVLDQARRNQRDSEA